MIEQDVSARLNPAIIDLQREVIQSGHPLRIKLFGMSMYPFIRSGDVTVIRAVEWTHLRRGDVIFYERESRLVAHRVMVPPIDNAAPLIAKGDTLSNFDPPVLREQLMGRVEALERGKRSISLVSRKGRWVQAVAAEISAPYSSLFWKVAAWRRRILRLMLAAPPYRARRRATGPEGIARRYAPADLDHLANCLWDLHPRHNFAQMRDWTQDQLEQLSAERVSVWVMEEGRRLVGAALLSPPDSEGRAWLTDLFIHPLTRGFGFGDRLLEAAESDAASQGARELAIRLPSSAKPARNLLRKRGWQLVTERTGSPPAPAFVPGPEGPSDVWVRHLHTAEAGPTPSTHLSATLEENDRITQPH